MRWFWNLYDKMFWTDRSWVYDVEGGKVKVTRYKTDTHYGFKFEEIDDG